MTESPGIARMPCSHRAVEVQLPDGTRIWASGCFVRGANERAPDFGLYAYEGWQPTWPADFIEWPDFGLPNDVGKASELIKQAYERARAGQTVEVGCLGGHGRTGTIISCMAILAGVAPKGAVAWTRSHYCEKAVETTEQEQWVEAFPDVSYSG